MLEKGKRAVHIVSILLVVVSISGSVLASGLTSAVTLVVNEIDYDQSGTDASEFIELKNVGADAVDLGGIDLVLVNGSGGGAVIYSTISLPSVIVSAGGFYVVCGNASNVANCDLDVTPNSNLIQNGSPDAVALVQGGSVIDTVSYAGDTGAPYTEGSGSGLEDDPADANTGLSRFPDGTDTDQNNVDLSARCITPGEANSSSSTECVVSGQTVLVINEIMKDPSAVFDSNGEWLELYNPTGMSVDINGWTISDDDIDGHLIDNGGPLQIPAGGFLVLGRNDDSLTNGGVSVDYMYAGFLLGNGADEVILLDAGLNEVDRVEYDDGISFPDPTGASMALADPSLDNNIGSHWCTSGTPFGDGDLGTPGEANDCGDGSSVLVINEVDYDQPGTDRAEFIEIKNAGLSEASLNGVVLELINGDAGGATVYDVIVLPDVTLVAGAYYVVCGDASNVANCDLDVTPDINLIQNGGPDAIALVQAGAILDSVSYEGNTGLPFTEGSGLGLEDDAALESAGIARCPDGNDTDVNNLDFVGALATPGDANECGLGACCQNSVCSETEFSGCVSVSGDFLGSGMDCSGDADGDGVLDACDECPMTPGYYEVRPNGCARVTLGRRPERAR